MINEEKFLPLGSVVLLKGGKRKVMITGYCMKTEENKNKIYDYNGCLYPEGTLSSNSTLVFDHSQIQEVFHLGYKSEESDHFFEKVKKQLEELEVL